MLYNTGSLCERYKETLQFIELSNSNLFAQSIIIRACRDKKAVPTWHTRYISSVPWYLELDLPYQLLQMTTEKYANTQYYNV